jgi:hypothetical protein
MAHAVSKRIPMAGAVAAARVVSLLLLLAWVAFNAYFLYYVDQLSRTGCQCALGWHRTFMEFSLVAFIIMTFVAMAAPMLMLTSPWLRLAMLVLSVAYIIVARMFIHEVRQCAELRAFEVLNVWNWIQIALLVFQVIVFIAVALRNA